MSVELAAFQAKDLTLRRGHHVVWKDATWRLEAPTVILGKNGQGKSSTLAMLAGQLSPIQGELSLVHGGQDIAPDAWMTSISLAAPWASTPGHLNLSQTLAFHSQFRTPRSGPRHWERLLLDAGLSVGDHVPVAAWSSGQRQRLSLALALGSESQVVLLDEPATNLDAEGIQWLQDQLNVISRDTLLVVATNDQKKEGFQGASILEV